VLIFWGGEGYGHLVSARAVAQELRSIDPDLDVVLKDTLDFPSAPARKFITGSYYLFTQFFPRLFDFVYEDFMKKAETVDSLGNLGLTKMYRPERMLEYVRELKPSCILVTFSPAAEMLIRLRDQGQLLDVPIGHVLIDYVCTKYFSRIAERLEMTFTPHPSFDRDFVRWGVDPAKVCASGVPIFRDNLRPFSKEERKKFLHDQQIDETQPMALLVSGAAGVGNFPLLVRSITEEGPKPLQLVVVCGRNEKNFRGVEKLLPRLPTSMGVKLFRLLPTETALSFVKAADVVVTKSGSLTPTEINHIGKSVVYLDINGGQERHNSQFILRHGLGLVTKKQREVGRLVRQVLGDSHQAEAFRRAQAEFCAALHPALVSQWVLARARG
jgi:processive 1,2-diacylglycerol beta-glucosyltransferase